MTDQNQTAVRHSPGPWHTCCDDGKCSCFTVMADGHPVAEVTHGEWGDEYPEVQLVGDEVEAYMEKKLSTAQSERQWHEPTCT